VRGSIALIRLGERARRPRTIVAALLLIVALAARVAWDERVPYRPINDAGSYLKLASQIAATGAYSTSRTQPAAGGTRGPSAYFPPGYPYFLAAVDLVDGRRGRVAPVHPDRLVQAALGAVTVGLIGLVALEVFGATVALIAVAIGAVYPVMIELAGTLTAENVLVPLVLAAVWCALRARRSQRRQYAWVALAGVLTGLAALTHVNGVVLLAPLGLAVWTGRPRWGKRAVLAPALLIGATALTIAPWTIRNAVVLHHFIPVSDETGITLVGTYNAASANDPHLPYKWRLFYGIPAEAATVRQLRHLSEVGLGSRLLGHALHYIRDHPFSPIEAAYHNTRRLLELEGSHAWRQSAIGMGIRPGDAQVGVICFWILAAIALAGAFTVAARRAPRWLWATPILLAVSVVWVNVETPRFRAPVDPFLIMLAALAITSAATRVRHRNAAEHQSREPEPVPAAQA
jgi:4-amino-4-deoxy-L-arabinose transferase-like glycosyltransferase